jgi:hypothetical protein
LCDVAKVAIIHLKGLAKLAIIHLKGLAKLAISAKKIKPILAIKEI